jgi:hypothetical protein
MRALVLNCTLKPSPEKSNTDQLAEVVVEALRNAMLAETDDGGARVVREDRPGDGGQPGRRGQSARGGADRTAASVRGRTQ